MPALCDLSIFKFPEYAPLMVKVAAILSVGPNVLALSGIILIDSDDQLLGLDI
jgi:hypothetical protein